MESGMEAVKALSLREKLQASYSGDEDGNFDYGSKRPRIENDSD